jgi:tRNA(Ile2) C34 agmatinyltransferase TiaS
MDYRICPKCGKKTYKRGHCYNCKYDSKIDGRKRVPPEIGGPLR